MSEKNSKKNEIMEIDLRRLWKAFLNKLWLICIASVVGTAAALLWTIYMVTPLYQSSAMFYVNNSDISMGDTSLSISTGDITASKSLVNTYAVILNSRTCLNDVIDYANLDYSYEQLRGMISASAVNETEVFRVVVTNPDPLEAKKIANAIAYILPNRISEIVEGTSAKIVDYAVSASAPSSPNYTKFALLGFLAGFVLSFGIVILRAIYDVTIRTEEDIEQCCDYPILAAVPDMTVQAKAGHKSNKRKGYSGSHSKKKKSAFYSADDSNNLVGNNISFAATEAYKLLRTKLQFSFVEEVQCPVIGISSAMAGEGKSLSSVNLAYTLAQLNKKVLLIDCDMRRPSLNTKLTMPKAHGLSNYLTGQADLETVVQLYKVDEQAGFYTIAAGRNPPNPVELLSSSKMRNLLQKLRNEYDYVLLDLPPVGEVSDAMAIANLTDGILLVVRQDYCTTLALVEAVRQFEFIESKILGIVLNGATEHSKSYGYKYRYGSRYYSKAYSKYEYAELKRSVESTESSTEEK